MRFNAINAFEKLLVADNNTIVMKFFLNLSKERQKEKLIERIQDPEKNYKHNDGDWEQRKYWDSYMKAYEDVLNRSEIPWINVPADQRWYRNFIVAEQIYKRLKRLKETYPTLSEKPKVDMKNG
jgi:polyphosphate kinase 2 (PPK2 family)